MGPPAGSGGALRRGPGGTDHRGVSARQTIPEGRLFRPPAPLCWSTRRSLAMEGHSPALDT
eukprot:11982286-Alexandrium_andersonii.AAC.1